jgi:CRP-like cAMP-binding protein
MAKETYRNRILSGLEPDDLALIAPHLERVTLEQRKRLSRANAPIDRAYFVEDGIVSTAAAVRHDAGVEIGIVGFEGMANIALAMGTDRAPYESFMQVGGHGYAIDAGPLSEALASSVSLNHVLLRYVHVYMMQLSGTVLANGRASVNQRLARWLVMAQDRIPESRLPLTHDFLSIMLGVRRAGVTVAINELERRGLVSGSRGEITIVDRDGLIDVADGYYGAAETEFNRLFGSSKSKPVRVR